MGRDLVLGSIVLLVTIRFFTEVVPVLPRAANFIDILIFLALALAAMSMAAFQPGPSYLRVGVPAAVFLVLAIASATINSDRALPAPVLVFIYGFLAPLAVYAAVYRIWPPGNAGALSRVLVRLGVLQLAVVVLIDVPRFASSRNPDEMSGTFGTNQYQLVFFLIIVATLLAGIFTLEPRRTAARLAPFLIPAILVVIVLAQYRAILATLVVTIVVVGILLGRHARGIASFALAVVALSLAISFVGTHLPSLRLGTTVATLSESPWSYGAKRYQATLPLRQLYEDDPLVGMIGTGPGTFSSRAWQTFANAEGTSASNVQAGYAQKLTGGAYRTDVSDRYVVPQLEKGEIIEGSRALSHPYSSYLSLAAEIGLFGLALILGLYIAVAVRSGRLARQTTQVVGSDPVPALAVATTIGFLTLLQLGLLENWLEVTRITFILWAMCAVVFKEVDARITPRP